VRGSPGATIDALKAEIVPTSWHRPFGDKLVGSAAEGYMRIRRSRPWVRNDLAPVFSGRLTEDGRWLVGEFAPSGWARGFMTIWLGALIVIFLPVEISSVVREGLTPERIQVSLTLLAMVAVGLGMPWLGWWFGSSDIDQIEAVLSAVADGSSPRHSL
jgi:hypothetical protein